MNSLDHTLLAGLLLGLAYAPAALADDPAPPVPAEAPAPPEVTMRIIENPDAVAPESITRRIPLPPKPTAAPPAPPRAGTQGQASESPRNEMSEEAAERGREMAEQAAERREEFGRSRAEEMRPERPEPPETPRPPRP